MEPVRTSIELIVAADEPALFFSSVSAAEGYLEAVDVRDGVYTAAYGPNGEPFSIGVEGDRVIIRPSAGEAQPRQLIELLKSLLAEPVEESPTVLAMLLDRLASRISA